MKYKKPLPYRIACRVLTWMHFADLDEGFEGDIEEDFEERVNCMGRKNAVLWLWIHAIAAVPKFIIQLTSWRFYMFKNYLKIAIRNMKRNKGYSFINIAGLSIGIACCILVYFYVKDEKTYDRFHENIDRIYYIMGDVDMGRVKIGVSPEPSLGEKMRNEFPEVENAVRLKKEELLIKNEGDAVKMSGISADSSFLDIFSFPLAAGDVQSAALDGLSSIVLTEKASQILFRGKNTVGETVSLNIDDKFVDYIVSGVTQPIPDNSSLKFDFLVNIRSLRAEELENSQSSIPTFLLLSDKENYGRLIAKFPQTIDKDLSERFKGKGAYHLHPLAGDHLVESEKSSSIVLSDKGNTTYMYILSGIALMILLTACFNYTNLSIGRFSNRMKEVGMRKVLGAQMRQISRQFLFESIVLSVFSLAPAFLLSAVLMPYFNLLVGKKLTINVFGDGLLGMFLFVLTICVSCVTGAYPSVVAARSSSVELFRGRLKLSCKNIFSRALIIFQFAVCIFLIIGTLFMGKQIKFMLSRNLGYDSEKIVRIPLENISKDKNKNQSFFSNYKNTIAGYNSIKNVCGAKYSLSSSWMLWVEDTKESEKRFLFNQNYIDHDYIGTLGIQVLQGRDFSREYPSDLTNSVIVNEEFVKEMEITEPVGKNIGEFFKEPMVCGNSRIIGVVEDFNYQSLSKKILPVVLMLNKDESYDYAYVKFAGSIQETINILEKEFEELAPQIPFEFSFLDEQVELQYQKEKKWSRIISWSSLFAVGIACSGLFGLTLLTVKKRTKEIGIRKVLGASVFAIVRMINKEFIWMIAFANVIAWPSVYYFANKFLRNYAYRIPVDIWTFLAAGLLSFLIAVLTISVHTVKAGIQNPVDAIKYE
jgi:putative ABC transport system permease protein